MQNKMITIICYSEKYKKEWDEFIDTSKNGTFMIKRDYMDYHSDRFTDFSLLFYEENTLIAIMPACIIGNEIHAHGGLTYGGIISSYKMTAPKMLQLFDAMKEFLRCHGIIKLIYKCIPSIYHAYLSDEDLYALTKNGAQLYRRDISTAIYLPHKIEFSELRKRGIKKALKAGLKVKESQNYHEYITMLSEILAKYHHTKPVHSGAELQLLANRFPHIIKLFCAYQHDTMLAGVVIFDTPQVIHTQYIANSDEGRSLGALDLIMDYLINTYAIGKKYFDFGISTEAQGTILNEGLISQKEMFGGRGIVYDFYELEIK